MWCRRSLRVDQINGHGEDPIAVRGALSSKKIPTSQRRSEIRHVCGAVETMRQDDCPGLVTDISENNIRIRFKGRFGWRRRVVRRAWSGGVTSLLWRGDADAGIGRRDGSG